MTVLMRWLVLGGVVAGGAAALWLLFGPLATWLAGDDLAQLSARERIDALGVIRGQIATVLSGMFVAGGLYYTGRRFFLDRDKQFTDRFNAAVDHLGAADVTVRAGGVRALGRILRDSPLDRDRVLETLTGFLRQHTRETGDGVATDRDDIHAAIGVLRTPRGMSRKVIEQPLDLRMVRLAGANLRGIRLPAAELTEADLSGATLVDADLTGARLDATVLTRSTATAASLRAASLRRADLTQADLSQADCGGADFTEANLTGASLTGCMLAGAILVDADLRGTDLRPALGLTGDQLRLARTDQRTRVPPDIDHPLDP